MARFSHYVLPALFAVGLTVTSTSAQAGSGSIDFQFLNAYGPFGLVESNDPADPTSWFYSSAFNGQQSTGGYTDGSPYFTGVHGVASGYGYDYGVGGRTFTQAPSGASGGLGPSSVTFTQSILGTDIGESNALSFTSNGFSNVEKGQLFTLGTLSFTNGNWYGAGATAAQNTPTLFGFVMATHSPDGAAFNQTSYGIISLTVNSPSNNNLSTLAGMEAEADWITVYAFNSIADYGSAFNAMISNPGGAGNGIGTFRVFDSFASPAGYTTTGTIDIMGMFNSLDLLGLANPASGFLTASNAPLPVAGGGVPETGIWAMMLLGFGAVGAAMRRGTSAPAQSLRLAETI